MSIKAVSWGMEQKVGDSTAKLILIAICDRYNDERGCAWPSVDWLAMVGDCSRRTVSRKLSTLEKMGFISVRHRYKQTSEYELNLSGDILTCHSSVMTDRCLTNNNINNNKINKRVQKTKVADWMPDQQDVLYANELGLDANDIIEQIRLWDEQNGHKAAYASVSAFFKNWCRREADRKPKRTTGAEKPKQTAKTITARQEAMIENLMPKYLAAYKTDDPNMIRQALTRMMAEGQDLNGWYAQGHGLKHYSEF